MKLLFENWRQYLAEQTTPTPVQIELVKDFLKSIALIAQASEDAGEEIVEAKAMGRNLRRKAQQRWTKQIKEMAGLVGVKLKDFTPEQRILFDDAKRQFKEQAEATELAMLNTIANGDLANVSFIRNIINKGGAPLRIALAAVVGPECVDNLSLRCIIMGVAKQISDTGIM